MVSVNRRERVPSKRDVAATGIKGSTGRVISEASTSQVRPNP
jgi:hypothetical protein